jgi:DNA-binding MarR family transcriptional regulator
MSSERTDRDETEHRLDDALRETSTQSVLFSQAVAEHVGLVSTDLEALDLLARHGPITPRQLAQLTGLTSGAITGLLDRLERRGYLQREPHPEDRRSVIVRPLTEAAFRDIGPAYMGMQQAMEELFARYSDDELAIVTDFLSRAATITGEQVTNLRHQTIKESRSTRWDRRRR